MATSSAPTWFVWVRTLGLVALLASYLWLAFHRPGLFASVTALVAFAVAAAYAFLDPSIARYLGQPLLLLFQHVTQGRYPQHPRQHPLSPGCWQTSPVYKLIEQMTDFCMRDFVHRWYDQIGLSPAVPQNTRAIFVRMFNVGNQRICACDSKKLATDVLYRVKLHLEAYNTAKAMAGGSGIDGVPRSATALQEAFFATGGVALHPAVGDPTTEREYLKQASHMLLYLLLPTPEYSSTPIRMALANIIAVDALGPLADLLCEPDFLYETIINVLDESEEVGPPVALLPRPEADEEVDEDEADDDDGEEDESDEDSLGREGDAVPRFSARGIARRSSGLFPGDRDFDQDSGDLALFPPNEEDEDALLANGEPRRSPAVDQTSLPRFTVDVPAYEIVDRHAEYLIELRSVGQSDNGGSWWLSRRYSEFEQLHRLLRQRFHDSMVGVALPTKRFTFKQNLLDPNFIHTRRALLDGYLQQLIRRPELARSLELSEFLKQNSRMFPKPREYKFRLVTAASRGLGQMTKIAKRMGNLASRPFQGLLWSSSATGSSSVVFVPRPTGDWKADVAAPFASYLRAYPPDRMSLGMESPRVDLGDTAEATRLDSATVILELCSELFGFQSSFLMARGAQQGCRTLFGSVVDKFLSEELANLLTEPKWHRYLTLARDAVWEDGELVTAPRPVKTAQEKAEVRRLARESIHSFLPPWVETVLGKPRLSAGIRNLLACVEHQPLTKHLLFHVLDILLTHFATAVPETPADPRGHAF